MAGNTPDWVAAAAAHMPLELLRLKHRRLDRVHPEALIEMLVGVRTWRRDGDRQQARRWSEIRPAWMRAREILQFHYEGLSAEVRRRRAASIIADVRDAQENAGARSQLLRPFLTAAGRKGLVRTAEERVDLAARIHARLVGYLDVAPARRAAPAVWIARNPLRMPAFHRAPLMTLPSWDAALAYHFLQDLRRLRVAVLPAIRLERTWAIWHVTNAEQAQRRRAWQSLTSELPALEVETEPEPASERAEDVPDAESIEREARLEAYLASIATRGRLGPRKAAALREVLLKGASKAEAARLAKLDRKTLHTFIKAERLTLTRLLRGPDPV
jgi:hypothetical protein